MIHTKLGTPMGLEGIEFGKTTRIKEQFQPFPGRQGTPVVNLVLAGLATAPQGRLAFVGQALPKLGLEQGGIRTVPQRVGRRRCFWRWCGRQRSCNGGGQGTP